MSRRQYDASRRKESAARTRAAIIDAGRQLFVERGYAATTVADIATAARVAPATVSAAFGGKSGLLKTMLDVGIAGDDEPVPIAERQIAADVAAEPDPGKQVALLADFVTDVHMRLADLNDVMVQASGVDEQVRSDLAWRQGKRREGMAEFVQLIDKGAFAPGLDRERAADIVWALCESRIFIGLVREQGWTPDEYRRWLANQLAGALLADSPVLSRGPVVTSPWPTQ
ncbi:MAG TPA: TetR/AcrR family transcriptional regulator [Actinomycetes bacterium]|nr:TetR/AcrR family transcriptional regulator [Actinomycetes bacterium]